MDLIFDSSLALYLPLYELDGASFMSKDAYRHSCTVTGALWKPGGRLFDGADDIIDCGSRVSVINPGAGGITVSYWINPANKTGDYIGHVRAGLISPAATRLNVAFHNSTLQVFTKDANWYDTGKTLSLNGFSYVSWIRKDGLLSLRINGEDTGWSLAHAVSIGPMDAVHVGRHVNTLDGVMGEVLIYLRGLSPLEDQHNYLTTKWRYR